MLYCKKCGNKLEDGANFCPKCGCPTDSTLANDSDTIVDNGKFAPNVQVQPTNQFEASTGGKSKLGCWSIMLYTFLFFILIGFLAEECDGGEPDKENTVAPQATEKVVSDTLDEEDQVQKQQEEEVRADMENKAAEEKAKKEEVAKAGYDKWYEYGFKGYEFDQQMYESTVKICFDAKYGAPVSVEEKELYKIFSDKFYDGYCEGKKVR